MVENNNFVDASFSLLSLKAKRVSVVINVPTNVNFEDFLADFYEGLRLLNWGGNVYYSIIHDKDLNDDGDLKIVHAHLVCCSDYSLMLKSWLSFLGNVFKVPLNCISLQPVKDFERALQYLVHANDNDKYQYSINDVLSNDFDFFKFVANKEVRTNYDEASICDFINANPRVTMATLVKMFGMSFVSRNRWLINDLKAEALSHEFEESSR